MNLAFQVRSFSSSGISTSNAQRHLFQAVRIGLESPQCRKEVSAWDVELLHSQDSEVLLPSPPPIAVLVACGGASASWPWRSVPMHGVFAASSASPFPASSPWVFLEHTVVAEVRTTKDLLLESGAGTCQQCGLHRPQAGASGRHWPKTCCVGLLLRSMMKSLPDTRP